MATFASFKSPYLVQLIASANEVAAQLDLQELPYLHQHFVTAKHNFVVYKLAYDLDENVILAFCTQSDR